MEILRAIPAFALAAFLIALIPGQGMAMVLRQTLVGGQRTALVSVLGNSSGLLIWGAASAVGLSAIFATSPAAYNALKFAGVAYLLFIAFQTAWSLRTGSSHFGDMVAVQQSRFVAYRTGLITNLTNAKAAVFAVAILPRFVPADSSVAIGVMVMATVWALVSGSTYFLIIAAIDKTSHLLESESSRRKLTLVSAVGITAMALGLAIS